MRLLGKWRPGPLEHDVLVGLHELAQLGGRNVRISLEPEALFHGLQVLFERVALEVQDDVAEHRDEPAIAVPRESLVAGPRGEAFDRRVVESEVEDRLHHSGHRHTRARAHGHEEGTRRIAEREPRRRLQLGEVREDFLPEPVRQMPIAAVVLGPCFRRDRETRWNGDPEVRHLGKLTALAAEKVPHQRGAFRLTGPEEVDEFAHRRRSPS